MTFFLRRQSSNCHLFLFQTRSLYACGFGWDVPHRLRCLNIWCPVGGAVCRSFGSTPMLEKYFTGGWFWGFKSYIPFPIYLLCFLLGLEMWVLLWSSHLICYLLSHFPVMMLSSPLKAHISFSFRKSALVMIFNYSSTTGTNTLCVSLGWPWTP